MMTLLAAGVVIAALNRMALAWIGYGVCTGIRRVLEPASGNCAMRIVIAAYAGIVGGSVALIGLTRAYQTVPAVCIAGILIVPLAGLTIEEKATRDVTSLLGDDGAPGNDTYGRA
jgi:hypothetical protein